MASKDDYVFTRDVLDNSRLNLMHSLWARSSRYVIHPSIPTNNPELYVAGVGAGTGAWLCDVSERLLKTAHINGLDISLDAMPPLEVLPSNVILRHWDVRKEVHEDLVGVCDVIQIRFFIFVLLRDEVPSVVSKLVRMLKPGGYLQWVDSDNSHMYFKKTKPENSTEKITILMRLLESQSMRLKPDWVPDLPAIFSESDTPPHLAYTMHKNGLIMHELIARKTQNEEMANQLKQLLLLAISETKQGAYIATDRYTIIGKKP
ncbi:UMTA methyltransferase family protein [Nemania serpens]|nr:UMTA methyltransferase family protein [Nemania serpens]